MEEKMIFLDTGFLFAYFKEDDKNHGRAVELFGRILKKEFGAAYLTDYVFAETMNLLRVYRTERKKIGDIGENLLDSEDFEFLYTSRMVFEKTWERFQKYDSPSFVDCSIVENMKFLGAEFVATFDRDFNEFQGEIRVIN